MVVIAGNSAAQRLLQIRLCSLGIRAEIGDVAHEEDAEFIGPVVEAWFVDFDVEAEEVEAEVFGAGDIGANCFVCEEGIDSFWGEGLIEGSEEVDGAIVEVNVVVIASGCFLNGDFAHAEVGINGIDNSLISVIAEEF